MSLSILVVEDNPESRMLAREILEDRGHAVVEAGTMDEARRRLDEARPDVIVLDVQFPGGGGVQLLGEIRARAACAGVPVVAVTAQAMRGDRERLLAAGFDAYLSKPIDTRRFGEEVEGLAARATARPS